MNLDAELNSKQQTGSYSFSKDKLPKNLSYSLKRSLLDSALRSASVYDTVWYVRYLAHEYGKVVLQADFEANGSGNYAAGSSDNGSGSFTAGQECYRAAPD